MKVQLISDTHSKHNEMIIYESVDMIVHAGDSTNYYNLVKNEIEFKDFIIWYSKLNIKYKVLIAGNHDAALTKRYNKDFCKEMGIIYLEDEYYEIESKLLFGSPWSPNFSNWYFMKNRAKLGSFWDKILIKDIDLLITHAPPKGILDLSYDVSGNLEMCGCRGLMKAVEKYKPKHHMFGHIHNNKDIVNFGERRTEYTNFYNVSSLKDGDFHKPPVNNKGLIIEI